MQQQSEASNGFYDDEAVDLMLEKCFSGAATSPTGGNRQDSTPVDVSSGSSNGVNNSFVYVEGESAKAKEKSEVVEEASFDSNSFREAVVSAVRSISGGEVSSSSLESSLMDMPLAQGSPAASAKPEPRFSPTPVGVLPSFPSPPARLTPDTPPRRAAPVLEAPVRGRVFTEPAWKTAGLVTANGRDKEIDEMETAIEKVKREIAELESVIMEKRDMRDQLRQRYASFVMQKPAESSRGPSDSPHLSQPPHPSSQSFTIELSGPSSVPLGLSVGFDEAQECFVVNEVRVQGRVAEHNRQTRDHSSVVYAGDRIVAVNGVSRQRDLMTKEFRNDRIVLTIRKAISPADPRADSRGLTGGPTDSYTSSPSATVAAILQPSNWPASSMEVYAEILDALAKKDFQRTGIMKFGDVPPRLPDSGNSGFLCHVCSRTVSGEAGWIEHFNSPEHGQALASISTRDFWSKFSLQRTPNVGYWYEHKIGFWALDDPDLNRTGSHTVARHTDSR